jgi:hypothetical protein
VVAEAGVDKVVPPGVCGRKQAFISGSAWLSLGTQLEGSSLVLFVSGAAADGVSAACTSGSHHFAGIGVCSIPWIRRQKMVTGGLIPAGLHAGQLAPAGGDK